jgi:hypothetical protein
MKNKNTVIILGVALVTLLIFLYSYTSVKVVIPKVIFQTSVGPPEDHAVDMIRQRSVGWDYKHFTDKDIIQYFRDHPIPEFDQIEAQFNRLKGAHKADLFRYYYLYLEGGVFLDSDAMIEVDMSDIARDYDFFSVNSLCNIGTIFQGLIGSVPENEIIYKALKDAYTLNPLDLDADYFLIVRHMHNIVHEKYYDFKIKLYFENYYKNTRARIYDWDMRVMGTHYFEEKRIPVVSP